MDKEAIINDYLDMIDTKYYELVILFNSVCLLSNETQAEGRNKKITAIKNDIKGIRRQIVNVSMLD